MSWEKKMQNKQNKPKNNKQQQQNPLCLHFQPVELLNVKGSKSRVTRYVPKIYIWLVISATLTLYLVEHVNMEKKKTCTECDRIGAKRDNALQPHLQELCCASCYFHMILQEFLKPGLSFRSWEYTIFL